MADSVQWNHCGVPWRKHSAIRTKAFKPAELKVTQTGGNNSAGKLLDVTVRGDPPISTPWLLRRNSHRFKAHSASRKTEPQLFRPTGNITESSVGHPIVPSGQLLLGFMACGGTSEFLCVWICCCTYIALKCVPWSEAILCRKNTRTVNEVCCEHTDGWVGRRISGRGSKSISRISVYSNEDQIDAPPWWKRSSIINLPPDGWLTDSLTSRNGKLLKCLEGISFLFFLIHSTIFWAPLGPACKWHCRGWALGHCVKLRFSFFSRTKVYEKQYGCNCHVSNRMAQRKEHWTGSPEHLPSSSRLAINTHGMWIAASCLTILSFPIFETEQKPQDSRYHW